MLALQRGFTLLELLGALMVAGIMTVGLTSLLDTSLDDTKSQQTALYQSQVATAANKYINDNYQTIVSASTPTTPYKIPLNNLTAGNYLSADFSPANPFGQISCIIVLQPAPKKLDVLIVTEGGDAIPDKDLAYIAANAGQGGGFILATTPLTAKGAFNSWTVNTSSLANYLSTSCSGTPAASGHLATAQFYDGPGSNFLYRNSVPGHSEFNDTQAPLGLKAQVQENKSDALCNSTPDSTGNTKSTWGRLTVDASGKVLSCQSGTWQAQAGSWKAPVADYASLPAAGNTPGDARIILDKKRGFMWDGTSWKPLAVDQNGRLATDNLLLNNIVKENDPCSTNGLVSRDASGAILSCQSGTWKSAGKNLQSINYNSCMQIVPSIKSGVPDTVNCPAVYPQSSFAYLASSAFGAPYPSSTYPGLRKATITLPIPDSVNNSGLIAAQVQVDMVLMRIDNRCIPRPGWVCAAVLPQSPYPMSGKLWASLTISDDTDSQSTIVNWPPTWMTDTFVRLNINLAKQVSKTTKPATVTIEIYFSVWIDSYFDQANEISGYGTIEYTPLMAYWDINFIH